MDAVMVAAARGAWCGLMKPLVVPGTLDSLGAIRAYVRETAQQAGIGQDAVYDLTLAVEEFATNAITHGYQEHGLSGDITVSAEQNDVEFIIRLEDTAPAFDPRTLAMPNEEDLAKPLEERGIGGLGVYLSVKVLDRFDYQRAGNRNCLTLAMNRASGTR